MTQSPIDPENPRRPPEPPADWLAWSLQLFLGLVVGGIGGAIIASRMIRLQFIALEEMHLAIAGWSLLGGGIASYRGNRTWVNPSIFDPAQPAQNSQSRACSMAIGALGIVTLVYAIYTHVSSEGGPSHRTSWSGVDVFFLVLTAIVAWLIFRSLRTGAVFGVEGMADRDETPLLFWFFVVSGSLTVIYSLLRLPH